MPLDKIESDGGKNDHGQSFMAYFLLTLPRNVIGCFAGRKIVWHLIAIVLTCILVASHFDSFYFRSTRSLWPWMFPAVVIGMFLPVVLPLLLLATGSIFSHATATRAAWAMGQAAFIGWLVASAYKTFTGRPPPPRALGLDTSQIFHFGFLRGGIFWGWPSSHTVTAFAMAITLFTLFPQKRWLGISAIFYAFYIGIGVSMTIHWFSDFAAGAIIGTVIGATVGKSFSRD
jgi:membrane-associated phospholipid phosphatase